MELVEGESLSDRAGARAAGSTWRARSTSSGRPPRARPPRTPPVWCTATSSPATCCVGADGIVKITDFGIAWSASQRAAHPDRSGRRHAALPLAGAGRRASKACPASDVYALGLVGYECLAGRRAFDGDNAVAIALMQIRDDPTRCPADVPDDVRGADRPALLKDPADAVRRRRRLPGRDRRRARPAARCRRCPSAPGRRAFGLAGLGFRGGDGAAPRRRVRACLVPVAALVAGRRHRRGRRRAALAAPVGPAPAAAGTDTETAVRRRDRPGRRRLRRPPGRAGGGRAARAGPARRAGWRTRAFSCRPARSPGSAPPARWQPGDSWSTVAYATEPALEPAAPAPAEQATTAETAVPAPAPRPAAVGATTGTDGAGAVGLTGTTADPGNGNGNGERQRQRHGQGTANGQGNGHGNGNGNG